jgi:hypothetical protein
MKHPITDKAQVSIDFPDKFYVGSFGRESSLDVTADDHGVHIKLERNDDQTRRVGFHLHYYLFADLIASVGEALSASRAMDEPQRAALEDAAQILTKAAKARRSRAGKAKASRG